jgi:hypothetical protein
MELHPVVWLIFVGLGASNVVTADPLHVGNFPDIKSCIEAIQKVQVGPNSNITYPGLFMCVPANTGKASDPPAPLN